MTGARPETLGARTATVWSRFMRMTLE